MRQMPRVAIIDALGSARRGDGIALTVEHAKRVAVLEYERLQFRERGGRRNRKRVAVAGPLRRLFPANSLNALSCFLVSMHEVDPDRKWDAPSPSPALFRHRAYEARPQDWSYTLLLLMSESESSDKQAWTEVAIKLGRMLAY